MPKIPTASQLADMLLGHDEGTAPGPAPSRTDRSILTGVVAAGYAGSGNLIPVQWDFETSAGSKLYPGFKSYAFTVGEKVMGIPVGSSYVVMPFGTPTAPSTTATDSTAWRGVQWIEPGTTTTFLTASTERTTSSTSPVEVKRFWAGHFGRYRAAAELHRAASAATITMTVYVYTPSGTLISAGTATTVNATYTAVSVDMSVGVVPGSEIVIALQTSNGSSTAYIQNVALKYQTATATPTGYSGAVLVD